MQPRKNSSPVHGVPQKPGQNLNLAHKTGTVQRKAANSALRQPPAAPAVYRPQPLPKVLQAKASGSPSTKVPVTNAFRQRQARAGFKSAVVQRAEQGQHYDGSTEVRLVGDQLSKTYEGAPRSMWGFSRVKVT